MRRLIFDRDPSYILKGLRSKTISEPGIPIVCDGIAVGTFQAIEIYHHDELYGTYTQTVADIISNLYFRLTTQSGKGKSATFGTSVVGTPSFRTNDGVLHFIPFPSLVEISTQDPDQISVKISAEFEKYASLSLERMYSKHVNDSTSSMTEIVTFITNTCVKLDESMLGTDAFRLCTVSSMFSTDRLYDANVIAFGCNTQPKLVGLDSATKRGRHLFSRGSPSTSIAAIKTKGSTGKRNSPGSFDSPSISLEVLESTIPKHEFGVQAFLASTRDIKSDSLSIWLEWTNAPREIPKGTKITSTFEVKAFPYDGRNSPLSSQLFCGGCTYG